MSEEIKKGLLGIVVDETTISHVVPELSALTYRGYTVQELCDKCDFEEVAYLVLNGELPNKSQLKKFIKQWRVPVTQDFLFSMKLGKISLAYSWRKIF